MELKEIADTLHNLLLAIDDAELVEDDKDEWKEITLLAREIALLIENKLFSGVEAFNQGRELRERLILQKLSEGESTVQELLEALALPPSYYNILYTSVMELMKKGLVGKQRRPRSSKRGRGATVYAIKAPGAYRL